VASLIDQAIQIAQEHGLKIIACGEDKAPIHKGWRDKATSDPDEIREMFSDPRAALVGVPTGAANDLLVFDIDYRYGNTPARNDALKAFEDELVAAYPGQIRRHQTRNGGRHLIMLHPEGVRKVPRNIMPKMEVCDDGFQVIWPTEDSGYEVIDDVPLDDLTEPEAKFLKIREKMKGISDAGGLMSAELAQQVMVSDGEVGTRHDALLRMTYDFVGAAPDEMTPEELCSSFEAQFREVFGEFIEPTRLEELMYWRVDGGEISGSDLGNAMKGAINRHPERSGAKLAAMERPGFAPWDEPAGASAQEIDTSPPVPAPPAPAPLPELAPWQGDGNMPSRAWVLSQKLERRRLSLLWGPPGSGKTSVAMVWSTIAASNHKVLFESAPGPMRVVYWNGEDGLTEIRRRFAGIRQAYPSMGGAVGDNLMILPTDLLPLKLVDVPMDAKGRHPRPSTAAVEGLREMLATFGADILVIDPLVASHRLREMDAAEMEVLFDVLRSIARDLNLAILCVHHVPASQAHPGPILGAVRHATQLKVMSYEDAKKQRLPVETRFQYVQAVNGKSNNAAHSKDRWIKLEQVQLPNGDEVVVPHSYDTAKNPRARDEVRIALMAMQKELQKADGPQQLQIEELAIRSSAQSNLWLGNIIGPALGFTWQKRTKMENRTDDEQAAMEKVHSLLGIMTDEGLIEEVNIRDEHRKLRPIYRLTKDQQKLDYWLSEEE
jgi:hypothetical protein